MTRDIKGLRSLLCLLAAGITFLVYLPSLNNGFVNWDDNEYIYQNPNIQSLHPAFFKWVSTAVVSAHWHPLTMLSYALDYAVWGLNPLGYHLTNIILHALNTLLVFVLASRLIKCGTRLSSFTSHPSYLIPSFITALLFGIHPLHVESVAWVSERKDVLYAFFFLLSLIYYLRYISSTQRDRTHYHFSLAFFALSLLSKPMAVSLPAVLLILDYYPLKRLKVDSLNGLRKIFVEKAPFFLLSILSAAVTISAQYSGGALVKIEATPIVMRCAVALHAYIFYLIKTILPQHLVPHYPFPTFITLLSFEYLFPMIVFTAATVYSLKSLKRNNLFSAAWLYHTITLFPVIGVFQVGNLSAADRYMYLPIIGPILIISLGVSYLLAWFSSKRACKGTTIFFLVLISAGLAVKTVKQISIWRDSITLWTYTINTLPDTSYTAYLSRGIANYDSGNALKAIKDYDMAIKLNPEYVEAYNNRGAAYFKLGEIEKALSDIKKVVALKPDDFDAYKNLGIIYTKLGMHPAAVESFSMALKINPNDSDAYNRLQNNLKKAAELGSVNQ